jgi:hypothetical protein
MNPQFYDAKKVPIRCDCGRPPEILRDEKLRLVTHGMKGWNPAWDVAVQYLAICSGGVCGWSEFTADARKFPALVMFLQNAYASGLVDKSVKAAVTEGRAA